MIGIVLIFVAILISGIPPLRLLTPILLIIGIVFCIRSFKKFLFDLIDHAKGTNSSKATPKRDKDATPPWEK